MMNPEIKAQWVAWLRANVDNQGREFLNNDGKFCCLGGLCELAVRAGVARNRSLSAIANYGPMADEAPYAVPFSQHKEYLSEVVLPDVVVQWAGLDRHNPEVIARREGDDDASEGPIALTELNDDWKWDFNQIADFIEAQL